MITPYGKPGDEPGDKMVFEALKQLPIGWLAYAQPKIVKGRENRNPDYVLLHKDYGYIVLEVKDYVDLERPSATGAWIKRRRIAKPEWEESPVEQGRKAAELLNQKLVEDPILRNFSGKLDFSYRYAGILPHLPSQTIAWLSGHWGEGHVLGCSDLEKDVILKRIIGIPAPFTVQMTDGQFDAVRAVLDEANCAIDTQTGVFKGIYSPVQEEIAKSPFNEPKEPLAVSTPQKQQELWGDLSPDLQSRIAQLEGDAPNEVLELGKARNVKLVRGFSGTGKTDVLVMRARYLYDMFPDLQMLVTTFNAPLAEERLGPEFGRQTDRIKVRTFDSLCKAIYQKHTDTWPTIQDVGGLIKAIETHGGPIAELISKYGASFVEQEITWMKEAGLAQAETYVSTYREGRAKASGQVLARSQKLEIFKIFSAYQTRLSEIRAFDWPDMHQQVWDFIQQGDSPDQRFDLILIDEAQHFAPLWMKIVLAHLVPNGSLFLCDDPSQSVYRFFSWEQKGVSVRGRTRWLRIPYRTTREIFEAGYALIQSNTLARNLLEESGENVTPAFTESMRTGERPKLLHFSSFEREKDYLRKEIMGTRARILPSEIAILHTEKHVREAYRSLLPESVRVDDLKRQTGMEYKLVFIPQVQQLFSSDEVSFDYQQARAQHQMALYMAMTRARDNLYLSYGAKWPREFDPIRPYVDCVEA